jgi:hypothetical protein
MWIDMAWLEMTQTLLSALPHGLAEGAIAPDWLAGQSWHGLWDNLLLQGQVLAQQQFDTDVFAGFRRTLSNFIESGQVWALLIGIVVGYVLRGITTYN